MAETRTQSGTPAETKPAAKTKFWPVLQRLRFNGVVYGPGAEGGDEVEMSAKEAKPLIAAGVLGDGK